MPYESLRGDDETEQTRQLFRQIDRAREHKRSIEREQDVQNYFLRAQYLKLSDHATQEDFYWQINNDSQYCTHVSRGMKADDRRMLGVACLQTLGIAAAGMGGLATILYLADKLSR